MFALQLLMKAMESAWSAIKIAIAAISSSVLFVQLDTIPVGRAACLVALTAPNVHLPPVAQHATLDITSFQEVVGVSAQILIQEQLQILQGRFIGARQGVPLVV